MAKDDPKDKDAVIEIRHFRSSGGGSKNKSVVVERVSADSDTGRFLARMESRRLAQIYQGSIDLRGRVDGECKRYMHLTQAHYLDDESYKIFRDGLQRYSGKFTVATYEAIISAAHIKQKPAGASAKPSPAAIMASKIGAGVIEPAKKARAPTETATKKIDSAVPAAKPAPTAPASLFVPAKNDYFDRNNPPLVPFGYYRKRKDSRLVFTTTLSITANSETFIAATKDISLGGCMAVMESGTLEPEQLVSVSYTDLIAEHPDAPLHNIEYRVARVETLEKQQTAVLVRGQRDDSPAFNTFLEQFINDQKSKFKLDPEDDLNTAMALSYQRIYTEVTNQLPVFFRIDSDGQPYIHAIGLTKNNQDVTSFFQDADGNYDLSALRIPHRIRQLCINLPAITFHVDDNSLPKAEALLIVYKDKAGSIFSAFDFELPASKDIVRLVRHAFMHDTYRVLKVFITLVRDLNLDKMAMLSSELDKKSAEEASLLRNELRSVIAIGSLVDITDSMLTTLTDTKLLINTNNSLEGLIVWHGKEQVPLVQSTTEPMRCELLPAPNAIQFGLAARRREERYLAKTKVELLFNGQRHAGTTRDISTRGLCIQFDQPPPIRARDEVSVAFLNFTPTQYECDIKNVRYRVLKVRPGQITTVSLERNKNEDWETGTAFFTSVFQINKSKLGVCINDIQNTASARLYEDLFSANLQSTPAFLGKDEKNKPSLMRVAVSDSSPELADFFYLAKNNIDYRALSQGNILDYLNGVPRNSNNSRATPYAATDLYLYKEEDSITKKPMIRAALSHQFPDTNARLAFIGKALNSGEFRFFRLSAQRCLADDKSDIELYLAGIRESSRVRATHLMQELKSLYAVGELADITHEITALLPSR